MALATGRLPTFGGRDVDFQLLVRRHQVALPQLQLFKRPGDALAGLCCIACGGLVRHEQQMCDRAPSSAMRWRRLTPPVPNSAVGLLGYVGQRKGAAKCFKEQKGSS